MMEQQGRVFGLIFPVVVETCGMLGRKKRQDRCLKFIDWIFEVGKVSLLATDEQFAREAIEFARLESKLGIDLVDACVASFSISRGIKRLLGSSMPILSLDNDFYVLGARYPLAILDPRSFELSEYSN